MPSGSSNTLGKRLRGEDVAEEAADSKAAEALIFLLSAASDLGARMEVPNDFEEPGSLSGGVKEGEDGPRRGARPRKPSARTGRGGRRGSVAGSQGAGSEASSPTPSSDQEDVDPPSSGAKRGKGAKARGTEGSGVGSESNTPRPAASDGPSPLPSPASNNPSPFNSPREAHNKYCHFCQHEKVKHTTSMYACSIPECQRRYCEYCLRVHLQDLDSVKAAGAKGAEWKCPHCRRTCCCSKSFCELQHRHCKAFRYRLLRAQQAGLRGGAKAPRRKSSLLKPKMPFTAAPEIVQAPSKAQAGSWNQLQAVVLAETSTPHAAQGPETSAARAKPSAPLKTSPSPPPRGHTGNLEDLVGVCPAALSPTPKCSTAGI